MIEFLALIGAVASLAIIGCMLAFAWMYLLEFIDKAKYKYRYKHRFDKSPTAKCYCIDCRYHDNKTVDAVDWESLSQDISILKTIGFVIMLIRVKRRSNSGCFKHFANSDFLPSCWRLCSSK